jgi:hypothetical protein
MALHTAGILIHPFIQRQPSYTTTACNNTPADKLVFFKQLLIKVDQGLYKYNIYQEMKGNTDTNKHLL